MTPNMANANNNDNQVKIIRLFRYLRELCALKYSVTTEDFMTCGYAPLSHRTLGRISSRITSELASVSRVVYDITPKPPATVEWE